MRGLSFALSPLFPLLFLLLIVSPYTLNRPQSSAAGFNIYGVLVYGPFRLVRSHFIHHLLLSSAFAFARSRRNFLVIVVRHAHNIDPRYTVLFSLSFRPIRPASGRSLFDARQLSRSIALHSFGQRSAKPFSFIYNLCSRFCKILAQMYDRGNIARGSPANRQRRHKRAVYFICRIDSQWLSRLVSCGSKLHQIIISQF